LRENERGDSEILVGGGGFVADLHGPDKPISGRSEKPDRKLSRILLRLYVIDPTRWRNRRRSQIAVAKSAQILVAVF
jgi:hypothetical protein